jgi:hypothetical protein
MALTNSEGASGQFHPFVVRKLAPSKKLIGNVNLIRIFCKDPEGTAGRAANTKKQTILIKPNKMLTEL